MAALMPREIASLLKEALAEETAARQAALAANPIRKTRLTSTDALAEFSAAETRYSKAKAHREQLSRIAAGLGRQARPSNWP